MLFVFLSRFPIPGLADDELSAQTIPLPVVAIQKSQQTLTISGVASSRAHEVILRQTALQYFDGLTITVDLGSSERTPPGWALVTELVLRALAHTDAARASISTAAIRIEGVTRRQNEYELALQRVESALPDGMSIESHVTGMSSDASFVELCQERFRITAMSSTIEFAVSTTDFNENALPLLDALIEIAIDCPSTTIRVTGHTDDSGDSLSNEVLGQARAMRIIEYMAGRGVPVDQLEAAVGVSDHADADGPAPLSRQSSRRAELELIIP